MSGGKADDACHWYAIHTHPKQEIRAESNLTAWGVETFNPKYKKRRNNEYGHHIYVSSPLFPRYIFARFEVQHQLHKICFTRGVHSVVSIGVNPTPIDDEIIALIQSKVDEDGFIRIGEKLKSGDPVVISDGPLKSLTGIFEREMKASNRVVILLRFINYQGHIQIEKELVEKIV